MQGFVAVRGIHLVGAFVGFAKISRRADGIAEGAVVGAGVFGGIGHDAHVVVAVLFERLADGADAAVHHVGRSDDIHTCVRVAERLFDEGGDGDVVQDVAVGVGDAVLSVNGVGVKRDVRHDAEFRKRRFHGAHGTGNEAVRVVSGGGIGALVFLADDGERGNGGDAEGDQFAAFFQEEVDGKAGNAGHGRDGFPLLLAFADENGLDEVVNG